MNAPLATDDARVLLATLAATVIGTNQQASTAKTLGEKVFWRLLRDEVRKEYESKGGEVSFSPMAGEEVVLRLPSSPFIEFQARDIEMMRACVAAHDAATRAPTEPVPAHPRSDTAPNGPATASHMLATLAGGCCLNEPDERDHAANVVVQCCIDTLERMLRGCATVELTTVIHTLQLLKMDVDNCTCCEENGVQSCG